MQSNNGDLYFRAGIDLDGFNAGATAMEKRMETASSNVVSSAGQMDDAISKIGGAFTRIVGAGAAAGFVKQMFNVRSEMQNTEAMLRVFLGSTEKAASFFKQLQGYAYNNVFEFKDLAAQSAQMLAYGNAVETVIPTINKLSEVAAGTNVPLEELVGIWNKVKVTDKMDSNTIYSLGAKGIDVRQAIADIKELETGQKMLAKEVDTTGLKFKDLQKIIDHVATNGGMFDGMMQEKMKTLGDSFGLMQDNLTNMFNEIGEKNQGLLKGGMDIANYLIENYESVAKVLGTLVVAYGTAKAASIAFNIAQKNGTGVAVLDNTVWAIRGNLLKVNAEGGKNITASIRQITAEQKEEIATLKAAITEQEHEEVIRKSRTANLGDVLTATQKARLEQMGLNEMSADYVPIAMSMLDKEQQMVMAKAELSNNNAKYIDALRDVVGMHGEETNSIDDRIEAATRQLAIAEKEADAAADAKEQLEKKVEIYKDYYEASLNNIDATDLQERQEALETAQSELEAAAKAAETASETRNTAQKKLNELQTKKNAIAEGSDTAATQANATAKNILSVAVGKLRIGLKALWAVMKANPVGAVVTVVTSLYAIISRFVNKSKEAKEAQEEENKELAEFHREVNTANDRLNTLQTALSTATRGSSAYNNALKQVNDMCKEYNVELINTNDSLQTQKEKYDNLKTAIEGVTAAKLREQFTTTALQNQSNRNEETMGSFRENLQSKYFTENFRNVWGDEMKFNTMWSLMLGKAQDVANNGYSEMFAKMELIDAMRKISGFKIETDSNAANYIRSAFDQLVASAKETQQEVKRADDALKIYEQTMNAHKPVVKEETTSIADLNKQLKAQDDIIKRLEKEAESGITKGKEEELEAARTSKQNIEKRLKNLGVDKATTKAINKAADERKKYLESLSKEEAMLIFDAEDAKIAAMQDGAEKEMATMQNNFNRQMTELDFERREIDKKRKEAKLPAINWEETDQDKKTTEQLIDEQKRHALEDAFDRNSKKVFDNEIEQRKKDYETYVKWVENVGQDAADRQYEKLIEKGRSFSEFVDNEIARLEEKSGADGLTDAELNYLDNLKAEKQRNQYQSYASMEEEMSKEIATATTLAEKLEIINKWLEKIKGNGDNSTSKDNILWKLSQQRTELLDEMNVQFNQTYERYAQKRLQTEREINRQISELNKQHRYAEADALKASLEQTLQELDTDFLKGLVSTVFKNPTKKNMREAMSTLQTIQNMTLDEFNGQFGNGQFKLTEEQFEAIKGSIGDVNTEIKKLGQGYTLADAFKDIRNGRIAGDLEQVARGTQFIQNAFSSFTQVVSQLSSALNDLAEVSDNENLKNTAKTVSSVSNVLNSAGSWAGTGASIGGGWGALIGAVLGGGLGIVTEILKSNQEKEAAEDARREDANNYLKEIISGIDSLASSVNSLSDTVTSLNFSDYRKSLLDAISSLKSDANYNSDANFKSLYNGVNAEDVVGRLDNKHIQELIGVFVSYLRSGADSWNRSDDFAYNTETLINDILGMSAEQQRELIEAWANGNIQDYLQDKLGLSRRIANWWEGKLYWNGRGDDDIREAYANQENYKSYILDQKRLELIRQMNELYKSGSLDVLRYFNLLSESDKLTLDMLQRKRQELLDAGYSETDAEVIAIDNQIAEVTYNMKQRVTEMVEGLFGTDLESIISDWIDIFDEFGENAEGSFDKIDASIDKMMYNMIRKMLIYRPMMEELTNTINKIDANKDGKLTDDELLNSGNLLKGMKDRLKEIYDSGMRAIDEAGLNMEDIIDQSTMTGSLQNLSEETGGVIAGRLNAMVINQAEGNNFLRQSLLVQYEMRNSLQGIQSDVATIKQRMNSANAIPFNPNVNYGYSEMAR